MKRLVALTLVFIICFAFTLPAQADISIDVILSTLNEEELVGAAESVSELLKPYGYTVTIQRENTSKNTDESQADVTDEDSVESDDALIGPVASEKFLADFAAGWEARSARLILDSARTSLMSDRQYIAYMSECISAEYDYINKYRDAEFEDQALAGYFQDYIGALDEQLIAISEYYGDDDALYNQYWYSGYYKRCQAIYWINRKWGMSVTQENQEALSDMVSLGKYWDMKVSIENDLISQLTNLDYSLVDASKSSVHFSPITITNNSAYQIEYLSISALLLDETGNQINSTYLLSENGIAAGKSITKDRSYISTKFEGIAFSCTYSITNGVYYDQFSFVVTPQVQYGWNGVITKNGDIADGQPVYILEDVRTSWEMNSSWSKKLYVPVVKFSVKNTGTLSGDRVKVHVIFTNIDTKEVWDEETVYVIGSSDSPLQPGYSKKGFAYSSVGYKTETVLIPNLTAEIYVNDILMETVEISE